MASAVSFQGISTGVKTDLLVNAMLTQEGRGVAALEARQAKNLLKSTALTSMKYSLSSFSVNLAVLQDKVSTGSATSVDNMQEVITKFNSILKVYKDSSATTRNSDGSIKSGPLAGDSASKQTISELRHAFTSGASGSTEHPNLASIGIKTLSDGSLSLNTSQFQAALASDPQAVKNLTSFTELKDVITSVTAASQSSYLTNALAGIEIQNKNLASQINAGQAALARRKKVLEAQFSKMEAVIAQMKAASGSLGTIA